MARKRVADVLVDTLVAAGVKRVYGLVGDSLNGVTDSIRPQKDLQWVPVRHEETAAFAAGAEAHLTGQLSVCAGSCGPGNLHLINGLYDCHRSRVPVLAIAAQIPSEEIGSGYFQESHCRATLRCVARSKKNRGSISRRQNLPSVRRMMKSRHWRKCLTTQKR